MTTANDNGNNVVKQQTPIEIRLFSFSTYTGLMSDADADATAATVVNINDDNNESMELFMLWLLLPRTIMT